MKLLKWLDENLEEFLMVMLLLLMTVIMGIQICARYVFNYSLSWSEELTRYLFIWSAFISVSYCTKKCISIKIEQVLGSLSTRLQAMGKLISHSIEFVFFIYVIPYSYMYLMSAVQSGQVSPALRIPMYLVQSAPLVAFVLVSIRIVQRWVIEFNTVRKG